ncbi:type III-A CRISPR-associated RAMP protein Csm3 [Thiomicrospira sp. R3]|uniref:type III-A CRISPR-associated RAMP protein Csm3 n=1 Tax=Thiomicrospira sp. R3 TaxID=3035472 RepID=UPI00259AF22D|nr:type III-A CRISPR-associated RAMP protein Csm3 [Thiomicrospira sp. R3]WFE69477.1 type III-A CRISPR-associated RAMP protein Csm3 [Thiomicrospira sp. R3]
MTLQLTKITRIEATLELLTGMHIGAGSDVMHIGGIDNPVIKNPIDNKPYIPGSSLKGKIRSLLEWRAGLVGPTQGAPVGLNHLKELTSVQQIEAKKIIQLFGASGDTKNTELALTLGPTRCSFWDAKLNEDWYQAVLELGVSITEDKTENTIDRISATAKNPRHTERVPAGAQFQFTLTFKHLLSDDEQQLIPLLLQGLKLLETEGLGGSGSRGYGKVKFIDVKLNGQTLADFDTLDPFAA